MNELILEEKQKLPNGWKESNLNLLSLVVTKGSTPTTHGFKYQIMGINFIKVENIVDGWIDQNTVHEFISQDTNDYLKRSQLQENDILFSIAGTIGRTSIIRKIDLPANTNQAIAIIRCPWKYLNPKYIRLILDSPILFHIFSLKTRGVGIYNLSLNDIKELKIPIPPLNEQKRIVTKIESIFSQIDAGQENLDNVKKLLKQNKQSTLKSAFKDNVTKIWVKVKLNDVCELIGGGTPSRQNLEYFNGNILWLTPTEIPKNKITEIYESRERITKVGLKKSSAKIIPVNSVLLTSRASIGYVAIAGIDVTTNQGFASFVCSEVIHNYFLAYWLFANKDLLKSKATGTTFKEISKSKLRELELKLPTLKEQKRIVSKIESIFGRIDAIENSVILSVHIILSIKFRILLILFTMISYHEFYNTEKNIHCYHNSR